MKIVISPRGTGKAYALKQAKARRRRWVKIPLSQLLFLSTVSALSCAITLKLLGAFN